MALKISKKGSNSMDIYVENEKTNALFIREVWLSRGDKLILNPRTLANLFDSDEKTIRNLVYENKGKINRYGVISFRNIKYVKNFENDLKERFSSFLVTKKITNEEVPSFNYNNYEKPGVKNLFESAYVIPIILGLIFIVILLIGGIGKLSNV